MALKIRLRQHGRTNRKFYRLVVADSRSPRDGRFVEIVGWYNPNETKPELHMSVKGDRVQYWLDQGAEFSDKAEFLVKRAAPSIVSELHKKRMERDSKLTAKKRTLRRRKKQEV
jgi:small subunit ribosomal protein S16